MDKQDTYLLYRHIRLDKNEVFYIGISNNDKRPFSKFSRNRYWKFITSKYDYEVEIIMSGLSRDEVESKEIEFISLYGRKDLGNGTLVNMTDGGTGGLGLKHTDKSKKKMKGRLPHNKNISKYDYLESNILNDINSNLSESKIILKYNCSAGYIYRLKKRNNLLKNQD